MLKNIKINFNSKSYKILLMLLIIIIILHIGFSLNVYGKQKEKKEFTKYWPSKDNARIKFVKSISNSQQLKPKQEKNKSFWGKITDFLFGKNSNKARLQRPFGLDSFNKQLYVADPTAKAVYKIDFVENRMQKLLYKSKGNFFSDEGEKKYFKMPIDVAVDNERIFVSDSAQQEILVFSNKQEGELIKRLGSNQLERPTGLGINRKLNKLYVVDTKQHKVYIYDTKNYKLIKSFGQRGRNSAKFNYPIDIFLRNNKVYISDSMNFRVQIFDIDGEFISEFGQLGDSSGNFARPKGIAVDSDGHIYVVDTLFGAVQIFSEKGQFLLSFGRKGIDLGEFWLPTGIHIDKQNNIYVADSHNHRVQIFKYLKQ